MSKPIIEVHNLSKRYRYGQTVEPYFTLRDTLAGILRSPKNLLPTPKTTNKNEFYALRDVSFEVKEGEVLGIIGPNGSGKSTLLKILSQITPPTEGKAILRGRVGSLLEVGTGFHQELTGRENIYLNGAVLGMSRREISKKFDEIVDFSGVEKFLDTPVKRYSSGMMVRLGFAVAAHLDPEILLIDEVLAVGDAEFQKKCLMKMDEVARGGRTILFVSHNLNAINQLCDRALYLYKGSVRIIGKHDEVVSDYLGNYTDQDTNSFYVEKERSVPIQIVSIILTNRDGKRNVKFSLFEDIHVDIEYIVRKKLRGSIVNLLLKKNESSLLLSFDTDTKQSLLEERGIGRYVSRVVIPGKLLKPGKYNIDFRTGFSRGETIQFIENKIGFVIENTLDSVHYSYDEVREGIIAFPLQWQTQIK